MDTIVLKIDEFVALAASRGDTTYEQQATTTGLGVGTLHRLRNGEPPSSAAIAKICNAYGVAFDDVFAFGTVAPKRTKQQTAVAA